MKKTITIIAYNRPHNFECMLKSLSKNNLEGWDILVGLDHSDVIDQQLDLLERFIPQAEVFKRDWCDDFPRNSIARNGHDIVMKAFLTGSEYNIYLEEDIRISSDVTSMADWYINLEEETFCLSFTNVGRCYQDLINSDAAIIYPNAHCTSSGGGIGFSPMAWCIKRDVFFNEMSPCWFHQQGWDWGVHHYLVRTDRRLLIPYQTRVDHLGLHGAHVGNAKHNRTLGYGALDVCENHIDTDSFYLSKEFRPCDFNPRERDDNDFTAGDGR